MPLLTTQFDIYKMKYQNKENNIYKNISQYFIPSNNKNSSITNTHPYYKYRKTGTNISNFNAKYKISIVDTFS